MRPGQPAAMHAFFHALVNARIGRGSFGPPRFIATILKKTHGIELASLLEPLMLGVTATLSRVRRSSVIGNTRPSSVLRRLRIERHLAGVKVDLSPLERQHFGRNAPAGDVCEFNHGPTTVPAGVVARCVASRARRSPFACSAPRSIGICGRCKSLPACIASVNMRFRIVSSRLISAFDAPAHGRLCSGTVIPETAPGGSAVALHGPLVNALLQSPE